MVSGFLEQVPQGTEAGQTAAKSLGTGPELLLRIISQELPEARLRSKHLDPISLNGSSVKDTDLKTTNEQA